VTCNVDRWRRLVSRMGQSVWPMVRSVGAPDRANAGPRLQCLVKLKLFRRGFFFPRCAAVGCRTGSRPSARGSSTCRTRLFFIVALTSSPTSSPIFSARNPASSANCLIISCGSGNGVMRSRPLYSILIANRGRPSVSSPGLAPKMIFLFRLACRFDFHH